LVMGENISQAAQFVQSGNADAGVIALSLAIAPPMKDAGRYVEIPAAVYPPILQAAVILKSSRDKRLAREFMKFVKEPETLALMKHYGFTVPQEVAAGHGHPAPN